MFCELYIIEYCVLLCTRLTRSANGCNGNRSAVSSALFILNVLFHFCVCVCMQNLCGPVVRIVYRRIVGHRRAYGQERDNLISCMRNRINNISSKAADTAGSRNREKRCVCTNYMVVHRTICVCVSVCLQNCHTHNTKKTPPVYMQSQISRQLMDYGCGLCLGILVRVRFSRMFFNTLHRLCYYTKTCASASFA